MQQVKTEELPKIKRTIYTRLIKRLLDICLSGTALIILSPILLIISILELIFHGRPIIFSQERPGLHGDVFKIYKFRSMVNITNEDGELLPGKDRITKFGKVLRKFSLDELPELICIFIGKMSIIGPRPLSIDYLPLYNQRHILRHAVRPGLACICFKSCDTWTWREQFENDIWYVENCSFLVDTKMIVTIAKEAIKSSEYRTKATRNSFNGKNLDE